MTAEGDLAKVDQGKSPTQLAIGRFRTDKLSMIAFGFVVTYILAAIAAPFLVKFGVLDPYTLQPGPDRPEHRRLPIGNFGGISWDHPLGVEPGTGRDVLSRIWYGITFSLAIALTATLIAIVHRRRRSASSPASPAAGSTPSSAGSST